MARIPFQDTFDILQIAGRWDGGSYNYDTFTADGQLHMLCPANSSLYHGIVSEGGVSFIGNEVNVQIVNAGNQALTGFEFYPLQIYPTGNPTNIYFWYIGQNTIAIYTKVGGTQTQRWSATYSATTHKYLRIRESAGTTYFGYSADGTTWVEPYSIANAFTLTDVQLEITVGTWENETSASTAVIDNLNILPSDPVITPPPDTSSGRVPFSDPFDSLVLAGRWDGGSYNIGNFTADGQLHMPVTAGSTLYRGLVSNGSFDLTAMQCSIQVINAGNQSLNSFEFYPMQIYPAGNPANNFWWYIGQNFLSAYTTIGGTKTRQWGVGYDPNVHKYLRIRESGGTIVFGYSTDGAKWTEPASVGKSINISAMQLELTVGTWQSEATATTAVLDNLNILPIDSAPKNNGFFNFF